MSREEDVRTWEALTPMADQLSGEGVGDAHSSDDRRDNITRQERRGITGGQVSAIRQTIEVVNYSNQEQIQTEIERLSVIRRKDRSSADKLRLFQLKLYDLAKRETEQRFYVLYDKIFLPYVLEVAFKRVHANRGAAGIDGVTTEQIVKGGTSGFLADLGEDLRKRTYKPNAVKRVYIEKSDGGRRPLGIPTVRDRVAQMACKLVIEPIFESDFADHSYGFRPKRSASGAIEEIQDHLKAGLTEVYDADLSKYFDTIPHDRLMIALGERISDKRVLALIRGWLTAPVQEEDGRFIGGKRSREGTPQGGVISPLLSNIYLNLLDRIVASPTSVFACLGIKMIRYADDFILMGRSLTSEPIELLHQLLNRMGLKIHPTKSVLLDARQESFEFLGFCVRYSRCIFKKGRKYWEIFPSEKSQKKVRRKVRDRLRLIGHFPPWLVARELNEVVQGWLNYFDIEGLSRMQVPRRNLETYLQDRIWRYYNRKSQRKSTLYGTQAYEMLTQEYGLKRVYTPRRWRPVNAHHKGH